MTAWIALIAAARLGWAASIIAPVTLGNVPIGSLAGAAAPKLEDLRSVGFAVLPLADIVGRPQALAVENAMIRAPFTNGGHIFKNGFWVLPGHLEPVGHMLYAASQRLASALDGERFGLHGAWTRDYANQELIGNFPHIDGDEYLTLSLSYGAPGTISYFTLDGVAYKVESEPGELVVNSGRQRQAIAGVPATIHQAPTGRHSVRRSMFAVYRSGERPSRDTRGDIAAREDFIRSQLQRR